MSYTLLYLQPSFIEYIIRKTLQNGNVLHYHVIQHIVGIIYTTLLPNNMMLPQ